MTEKYCSFFLVNSTFEASVTLPYCLTQENSQHLRHSISHLLWHMIKIKTHLLFFYNYTVFQWNYSRFPGSLCIFFEIVFHLTFQTILWYQWQVFFFNFLVFLIETLPLSLRSVRFATLQQTQRWGLLYRVILAVGFLRWNVYCGLRFKLDYFRVACAVFNTAFIFHRRSQLSTQWHQSKKKISCVLWAGIWDWSYLHTVTGAKKKWWSTFHMGWIWGEGSHFSRASCNNGSLICTNIHKRL